MNSTVVIMAKRPEWGRVKTRLASTIGNDRALMLYRFLLQHTLNCAEGLDAAVYWTGDGPIPENGFRCCEQSEGDLGHRMLEAIRQEQNDRSGVVVIGTDCPGLDRRVLLQAMQLLERHDVVLGPTLDGGYYLIAMRHPIEALFKNMPWSTDRVFELALNRCRALGLAVATLPKLSDVDTEEDMRMHPMLLEYLSK